MKAKTPRASSTAVTHKHKKAAASADAALTVDTAVGIVATTETAPVIVPPSQEEVAIRAYLIAESRGFQGGCPEQDWLQAERELLAERQSALA